MSIPLLNLEQFVGSLNPVQREFFLAREFAHERRYMAGFDACGRALGVFSELQSQSTLAACRTFLASAPEALLAHSFGGNWIEISALRRDFRVCFRQKGVRPFGLRAWTASAALRRLPMEEPLAARRALQPSAQPHNASHVESPTGC